MHDVLFGTVLTASFLGGVVALLAPCCVSVVLPAYLATGFRRRTGILAATLVFAVGVGTVIMPIGLGASTVAAAVAGHHLVVFSVGGTAMLIGGAAVVAGWEPRLPMPRGHSPTGRPGVASVYGLGLFSGAASACCAPVLAGVVVLAGASPSFPAALAISGAYVAGVVAPLLALALVWEARDWGSSRWLHGRAVTIRIGGLRRRLALGTLASGLLLIVMGVLTLVAAVTGPSMPSTGWRIRFTAALQHAASVATSDLAWLPGWVVALLLLLALILLARIAIRTAQPPPLTMDDASLDPASETGPTDSREGGAATADSPPLETPPR
jgi:cytochrome c-type biogenesis protein